MMVLKRYFFRAIATKTLPSAVMRCANKVAQLACAQLKCPAVANFVRGIAGIADWSGFNPEIAMPVTASRTVHDGMDIANKKLLPVHCKKITSFIQTTPPEPVVGLTYIEIFKAQLRSVISGLRENTNKNIENLSRYF